MDDETVEAIVEACANVMRVFGDFANEFHREMMRLQPVLEELNRMIAEKAQDALEARDRG